MIEPEAALALILSAVNDITFLPAAAAMVVMLTSISKRYIPNVRSEILALFWQVASWILWVVVKEVGFDMNQFDLFVTAFATILTGVVGGIASQAIGTPWLYNKARNLNAPMLSYERPKQLQKAGKHDYDGELLNSPVGAGSPAEANISGPGSNPL